MSRMASGSLAKTPEPDESVDGPLHPLTAFGMVMAVNHGAFQLFRYFVKLVAEMSHLVSTVLITGDDLVNRVDDHRRVILLGRPADKLRRQLVHGDSLPSKIPYVDISQILRREGKRFIHIPETMQAGRPVQFQIAVKHIALSALECLEPFRPLGDGDAHLNECKGLPCL